MPIYEYSCTACGRTFEKIQKVGSHTLRKCEECGGKLEKLVSRSAFHLKGGGWFDAGYSKPGGSRKPTPASSGTSSTGGKSGGTTDKSDTDLKKIASGKSGSD